MAKVQRENFCRFAPIIELISVRALVQGVVTASLRPPSLQVIEFAIAPLDILQHASAFERAVVTPYTFTATFLPSVFSFYAMAVLVQLPHMGFYRTALLPVVFWLTFRAGMSLDFSWNHPGYVYLNQGLALAMFTVALRSTAWAFTKRPYVRLPVYRSHKDAMNEDSAANPDTSVSSAMWNAADLIVNLRGLGWIGPQKMHIPTSYFHVESRLLFFLLSLCRTILFWVVFDILRKFVYVLGSNSFGTPEGGSIFDLSLPPLERYLKSSTVTLLSGGTAYTIVEAVFHLHATLFVMLFQQYPSQWPPLFDSPWLSTSLTSFWGRRWHQLFREYFVAVGSKPVERYLGRTGIVFGAFTVSGFLHDAGMRGMDRGADTTLVVGFFIMQGVGIIIGARLETRYWEARRRDLWLVMGIFLDDVLGTSCRGRLGKERLDWI
ncbi:membrane bound O-acyl transferase family-domain-containing protein [Chiua virens]|nr:membrane bound O-acyl transferase family-domain-containing protein [Chiua virens]